MQITKIIREEPFKSICLEEWERAKTLLPSLNYKLKPKFLWVNFRGWKTAECDNNSKKAKIRYTLKYLKQFGTYPITSFRLVTRHEILHLICNGHGRDFIKLADKIGASHFRTWNFMTMKPTVYGEPILKGKE